MNSKYLNVISSVLFCVSATFAHSSEDLFLATNVSSVSFPNVIISKVSYNPKKIDLSEHAYEWFELYNPTSRSIEISNWTVAEDQPGRYFIFPENTTIDSGSILVVVNNEEEFLKQYSAIDFDINNIQIIEMTGSFCSTSSGCLLLNNSEDSLTLRNSTPDAGSIVDFVAWENRLDISDNSLVWSLEVSDGEFICRKNSTDTDMPSDFMAPCLNSIIPGDVELLNVITSSSATISPSSATISPSSSPVESLPSVVEQETIVPIGQEVAVRASGGTGGQNPLVVERLRKAGLSGISYETIGNVVYENVVMVDSECNYNDWLCAFEK